MRESTSGMAHIPFVSIFHNGLREPLAEMQHHRWIPRSRILAGFHGNEELEIWFPLHLSTTFSTVSLRRAVGISEASAICKGFLGVRMAL